MEYSINVHAQTDHKLEYFHWGSTDCLLLLRIFSGVVWRSGDLHLSCNTLCLSSPRLCFFKVIWLDLFVGCGDSLTGWRMVIWAGQPAGCLCRIGCGGWGCVCGAGLGPPVIHY